MSMSPPGPLSGSSVPNSRCSSALSPPDETGHSLAESDGRKTAQQLTRAVSGQEMSDGVMARCAQQGSDRVLGPF